tara:strand:+ start:193 stop:426 length:234 start_codon:yes stop_codon:yes gene_type:complete
MASHTNYKNKITEIEDPAQVSKWIRENLSVSDKISIGVTLNYDFTVKLLEIGKSLSNVDKTKLLSKFPELEGKEIAG